MTIEEKIESLDDKVEALSAQMRQLVDSQSENFASACDVPSDAHGQWMEKIESRLSSLKEQLDLGLQVSEARSQLLRCKIEVLEADNESLKRVVDELMNRNNTTNSVLQELWGYMGGREDAIYDPERD